METRAELIERLTREEWAMFDKVHNEGGRADCQDNQATFWVMRQSQLSAWSDETLQSYARDLQMAREQSRNLLTEKYAYMMAGTAPAEYEKIKALLPQISPEKKILVERLVAAQVAAMEQLAARYPRLAARMRTLHSVQDTPWDTSFETYQRGELYTYSMDTLRCYERQLVESDGTYGARILTATAQSCGFDNLEQFERALES